MAENQNPNTTNQNTDPPADPNANQTPPNPDEGNQAAPLVDETTGERLYRQSEVDSISGAIRARALTPDEHKEWKAYQAQKKAGEDAKLTDEARQRIERAEAENSRLEAKVEALSQDTVPEALDDVISLARLRVSDSTDIKTAITAVLKLYPHFKKQAAAPGEEAPKPPSFVKPAENKPLAKSSNEEMNDLIRSRMRKGN